MKGEKFSLFVNYILRFIFVILSAGVLGMLGYYVVLNSSFLNIVLILIYILLSVSFYYVLKRKVSKKIILLSIIFVGILLRLLCCFSINNVPASDYKTIWDSANALLKGDTSSFFGNNYFARFPHLIIYVLYQSLIIKVFNGNALIFIKLVNVLCSTVSIYLIYLIAKEIFNDEKRSLIAAFLSSLFPAFILYTASYCTESIAIPFYLGSLYYFVLVMKKSKKDGYLLLSGLLLLIGHLFRMVAQVVLVAYIMFIFIYLTTSYKDKFKKAAYILVSFIIPFVITGYTLIGFNVTDTKLWSGREPAITSILKGSNFKSNGQWSEEDAAFIQENLNDTDKLKELSKEKIINRYTTASPVSLIKFVGTKLVCQWFQGDFGGSFWAELDTESKNITIDIYNKGTIWFQLFYVFIFAMIIKGLFKDKEFLENKLINILYILFSGYGLLFLILESQARYAYIISWVFILLAVIPFKDRKEIV